jgi:hypothetical protein
MPTKEGTMQSPSISQLPPPDGGRVSDALRLQILATEHSSLLATRSITWNETFSRAAMFLTVLSAAVVALALVAQASGFGSGFRLFALIVLPIVLLVGLGSLSRIAAINAEDFWLVVGMNRLRHAYLELAPELEPYFVTGHQDDIPGVAQTYFRGSRSVSIGLVLFGTPIVIGAINAVVAGVLVALIAQLLGASVAVGLAVGLIGGAVLMVVLVGAQNRWFATLDREYYPRFPG